jgi:hypothetical protein
MPNMTSEPRTEVIIKEIRSAEYTAAERTYIISVKKVNVDRPDSMTAVIILDMTTPPLNLPTTALLVVHIL